MNCSLKRLCEHRGLSFDPSDCDHIFVSRSRRLSPCAAHNLMHYGDCVANRRHCLRFPSLLTFQYSWISWISWGDKFPCTYRIFRIVQVFLIIFRRDKFPCTLVQKCIFLPSLRTRRCVVIAISCVKFIC